MTGAQRRSTLLTGRFRNGRAAAHELKFDEKWRYSRVKRVPNALHAKSREQLGNALIRLSTGPMKVGRN
jgi:hypothetical protein